MVLPSQRIEGSVAIDGLRGKNAVVGSVSSKTATVTNLVADSADIGSLRVDGTSIDLTGILKSVQVKLISGGAAGDHTVQGITTSDTLVSVIYVVYDSGTVVDVSDLTSEFTISAADTINNAEGTNTTGGKLLVIFTQSVA